MSEEKKRSSPRIRTTLVGSYPAPDWLLALPSEQALADATGTVFKIQELAGIDVVVDGELYRFDPNHPDTNGMIDYFIRPLSGVRSQIGLRDLDEFHRLPAMQFRARPAGVVEEEIGPGTLDLVTPFLRARKLTQSPLKFTVTGPHMLARTLLDRHYRDPAEIAFALAKTLADQVRRIDAEVIQIDEANITGHPEDASWASEAINVVLEAIQGESGVHLCFGNYGGQTVQQGAWRNLIDFINKLRTDHVLLETADRNAQDVASLAAIDSRIGLGLGVVDIKTNRLETADEIARRIETAEKTLGTGRIQYVNPDCGFWMLKRSVADRKIRALVQGRDRYLGLS